MAFQTSLAAVVALALALMSASTARRNLLLGVALFCLVGVLLPMSRGGTIIAIVSCVAICLAYQGRSTKVWFVALVLGAGLFVFAPNVTFTRLTGTLSSGGVEVMIEQDGRMRVWADALHRLPDYVMTGVGHGNFWTRWSASTGVHVAHNCFLQITIYWGVVGLLALLTVVWQASRCIPRGCGSDALGLCLLGIAVCLLLRMLVSHNFADKDFSLGLGMLVAARLWIWPNGLTHPLLPEAERLRLFSNLPGGHAPLR